MRNLHLRLLFAEDPERSKRFTLADLGLYFDYSKNPITSETIRLLLELAEQSGLRQHIDAMFAGDKINVTEQRAVLHVALRAPKGRQIFSDGVDVVPEVHAVLDKIAVFVEQIRSGAWKGHTGKRIRNVVNIGIGGSDLGPVKLTRATATSSKGPPFAKCSASDFRRPRSRTCCKARFGRPCIRTGALQSERKICSTSSG